MRRLSLAALAGALIAGGLVFAQIPAANAATACTVDYTANQWSTGFTADVKLTNNGPAISAWTLTWSFTGDQRVTSAWSSTVAQSGKAVTASNASWNGTLGTGASTSFGFQATYSGTNPPATGFTLNGTPCAG